LPSKVEIPCKNILQLQISKYLYRFLADAANVFEKQADSDPPLNMPLQLLLGNERATFLHSPTPDFYIPSFAILQFVYTLQLTVSKYSYPSSQEMVSAK
jgi:hypothetical protein